MCFWRHDCLDWIEFLSELVADLLTRLLNKFLGFGISIGSSYHLAEARTFQWIESVGMNTGALNLAKFSLSKWVK